MKVSLVVALDKNRVIGHQGKLPWHFSEDLKYFKKLTLGHAIIMGRKTFDSIGRPLPGRQNIVVTRQKDFFKPGITVVHSLREAFEIASGEEVFVIGGEEIFRSAMGYVTHAYVTQIDATFAGDTYFPELPSSFKEVSRTQVTENDVDLSFCVFENTPSGS